MERKETHRLNREEWQTSRKPRVILFGVEWKTRQSRENAARNLNLLPV